ncbi:energy transducer TonB [Niabella sp. 22666]|uniref:energy transducer TonB n=1 Tax=Niabella sp. 22666 TaxID=3453954 RepID=UPI003F8647B0
MYRLLLTMILSSTFFASPLFGLAQIKEAPEPQIFIKAEIDPVYRSGHDGWIEYLAEKLDNNVPYKKGAPQKTYKTVVEFTVEKDGSITNLKPLTSWGYGMEEEAVRLIESSGKWNPAIQNRLVVRSLCKQAIIFSPSNVYKQYLEKYPLPKKETKSKANDSPLIFSKVEKDASFPGGIPAWREFLVKNLNGMTPVKNGAAKGMYTVIAQFIVDTEGNISDIRPLTFEGFGMEDEVVRVLKKSGKWSPAIQDGNPVKAYRKQPITFMVN